MKRKHSYITPELQYVLGLLKKEEFQNYFSETLPINLQKSVEIISKNNLSCFLFNQLPESHELRKKLLRHSKKRIFKNMSLQADLLNIIDRCNESQIKLICFKGHPLNEYIYKNTSLRTSTDVDVLVPLNELERFTELLLNKGYKRDNPTEALDKNEKKLYYKIDNQISFISPNGSKIDVHFKPFKNDFLFSFPEECIIKAKYQQRNILRFNNIYTLNYLIIHGSLHQWSKLMWLIDIVKLSQQLSDEELKQAFELAEKNKVEDTFIETFYLCNVLFEMHLPEFIENKIKRKHSAGVMRNIKSIAGKKTSKIRSILNRYNIKKTWEFRLEQFLMFPSRDLKIIYLPFGGRVLYPLLRPITYLFSDK